MYQRALDGYEEIWGPDHPSTLRTINALDKSDGVLDTNQHPQLPPSTGNAILNRLKARLRRRKGALQDYE